MAIKPTDLINNPEVKAEADRIEKEIDRKISLRAKDFDGNRITLDLPYPGKNIFEELKKRYLAAGWKKFEYHSHQYDSYLEISM